MCVLVVKNDKDGKPLWAKSRIFVLGKFEDRVDQKSQRYALILKYIYLQLLTTKSVWENSYFNKSIARTRFATQPFQPMNQHWPDLPLATRISKKMSTGSSRKNIWIALIPPSLVQYDQRDSTKYRTQYLTIWALTTIRCTYQPLLSRQHPRTSISTPHQPLCQQFRVLLLISIPGGPIQKITPRTHPSWFNGKCWLFIRYWNRYCAKNAH